MEHKYSTYVLLLLISILILGTLTFAITSEELDEVCSDNSSILFRNETSWVCSSYPVPINITNTTLNDTLQSVTDRGATTTKEITTGGLFIDHTKDMTITGSTFTTTSTSVALSSTTGGGSSFFRALTAWTGSFSDSVPTTYFQVGKLTSPTLFSGQQGSHFSRLGFVVRDSTNEGIIFTDSTANIPMNNEYYFQTREDATTTFAIEKNGNGIDIAGDIEFKYDASTTPALVTDDDTLRLYNNSAKTSYGILELHDIIYHSSQDDSLTPLEEYNGENTTMSKCRVETEVPDTSRPVIETKNFEQCTEIGCVTETEAFVTYPFTVTEIGSSSTCLQEWNFNTNKKLNNAINIVATTDGVMVDTDIISAETIYTESKMPIPDVDYASVYLNTDISKKDTHYATVNVGNQERLDMEERIVHLEGAMQQIITESCQKYDKYSWC